MLPEKKKEAKFSQIYIYDTEFQADIRLKTMPTLNQDTLIGLQNMMQKCNPYVKAFQSAAEFMKADESNNFQMIIKSDLQGKDIRKYNKPTSSDIAVVIQDDCSEPIGSRDIVINKKSGDIIRISELNGHYDPLMYVLLFPYGEKGFELGIKDNFGKNNITQMEYYSHCLQCRDHYCILHRTGRLFQQYIVDMYSKIE